MKPHHFRKISLTVMAVAAASCLGVGGIAAATKGDLNQDGKLNLEDIRQCIRMLTAQSDVNSDADWDEDEKINASDLTGMKRTVLEQTTPAPSGNTVVTAITYDSSSVILYDADGKVVPPEDAQNVTVTNETFVTVTQPGELDVDGACEEGQLKIDCDKTAYAGGQVTVNLRGLSLSCSTDSPIYVAAVDDEFVLSVKSDTVNTISDGTSYTNADGESGAIYSCDDMKIKGRGALTVHGNCTDGIVSKNDLKLWNGHLEVNAADDGIRGKDSVRIGDPDATDEYADLQITVNTESGDGICSTNSSEEDKGFVRITGGTVDIHSYADGIQAEQLFEMQGGNVTIETYEGSGYTGTADGNTGGFGWGFGSEGNANKTDISAKGIKAAGLYDETGTTYQSAGDLLIQGGTLTIDSSDDCLHAGGTIALSGGVLQLASGDDAAHSDHEFTIGTENANQYDDVVLCVSSCYEGIEGESITQYSGSVIVNATDDGYNAAGGADSSGQQSPGGWGQGGGFGGSGNNSLTIAGGLALVNVSDGDHDGFDSNGPLTISGGFAISNGNAAFDCGEGYSCSYTGGIFVENTGAGGMGGMGNMGGGLSASLSVAGNVSAGERITLVDDAGNVLVSFLADKNVSKVAAGTNGYSGVKVYAGGTLSGASYFQDVDETQSAATGGTLEGGTELTASSSQEPWGNQGGRSISGGFRTPFGAR